MRQSIPRSPTTRLLFGLIAAAALFPSSVLAIASYDAGAFFQFTSITADDGVFLDISVEPDDNLVNTSTTIGATATATSDPAVGPVSDPIQDVRVTGSAGLVPGASISSADAFNRLTVAALNTNTSGGTVDVVFEFIYGADVMASLTDMVTESAFASAGIFMDTVFGGAGLPGGSIVDVVLDLFDTGQDSIFNFGSYTLTLQPGEFNGVYVDLSALGQAISISDPDNGVPLPATLALLMAGLIGMARGGRAFSIRA